jgi:hypothetical protein
MRVRIALGSLTAAGLILSVAPRLHAQVVPSPFRFVETRQEAGLFFGTSSLSRGRFGFGPSDALNVGGRWGIRLSGPLGFEAAAGLISGSRDVINPARPEGERKVGKADAQIGTLDGRLRLQVTGDRTWHRLAPFFVAGGGIAFDLSSAAPDDQRLEEQDRFDFGTSFFGTLGTGANLFLSDRLTLRADGIFSLWKLSTPPGFSDPERGFEAVEESEWVSGLHLSLTAAIRF